jgi:hypothetical protein
MPSRKPQSLQSTSHRPFFLLFHKILCYCLLKAYSRSALCSLGLPALAQNVQMKSTAKGNLVSFTPKAEAILKSDTVSMATKTALYSDFSHAAAEAVRDYFAPDERVTLLQKATKAKEMATDVLRDQTKHQNNTEYEQAFLTYAVYNASANDRKFSAIPTAAETSLGAYLRQKKIQSLMVNYDSTVEAAAFPKVPVAKPASNKL